MPLSPDTSRRLIKALRDTTGNLNLARILMGSEASKLAKEIVTDNNTLIQQAERELSGPATKETH